MNIFDIYLDKIKKLAIKLNKKNVIKIRNSDEEALKNEEEKRKIRLVRELKI